MATFIDIEKKEKKLLFYNHDVSWDGDIPVIQKAEGVPIKYDMTKEPFEHASCMLNRSGCQNCISLAGCGTFGRTLSPF